MRVLLGLAVLVIVLATAAQLVKSRLGNLSVTGGPPAATQAAPASATRELPAAGESGTRAADAGAPLRASDPQR